MWLFFFFFFPSFFWLHFWTVLRDFEILRFSHIDICVFFKLCFRRVANHVCSCEFITDYRSSSSSSSSSALKLCWVGLHFQFLTAFANFLEQRPSLLRWMQEWVNECVDEWVSEWVSEWMHGWVSEWMHGWMNEWMNGWVSEWLHEWMSEWMNAWMDER